MRFFFLAEGDFDGAMLVLQRQALWPILLDMNDQVISWLTFAVIAALIIVAIVGIVRFWNAQLNLSDEDIALERRVSALNEDQANRRRDDEIVRLLSGDEQRIIGSDDRRSTSER